MARSAMPGAVRESGNPAEMGRGGDQRSEPATQAKSLRLEAGEDLARGEPRLLPLVLFGHENDLLRSHPPECLELLDGLLDPPPDGAVLRRFPPRRQNPFPCGP